MELPTYLRIELLLSTAGFRGRDLEDIRPDFETERDVSVGLKWYPSATGPETWTLAVAVGVPLAVFLNKFGDLLAADLYAWAKKKLAPFFASRTYPSGFLHIELGDIEFHCSHPLEALSSTEFIALLKQADPSKAKEWHLEYDEAARTFTVRPEDPPSIEGPSG